MSKEISIENFDVVKKHLRDELSIMSKKLASTLKQMQASGISSFDMIKIQSTQEMISQMVGIYEHILKGIELNPTINVTTPEVNIPKIELPEICVNVPDIKVPTINVPEPRVTINNEFEIEELISGWERIMKTFRNPTSPLAVRISDGKKFVDAIKKASEEISASADRMGVVFAGNNGGMTTDEYRTVGGRDATDFILNGSARLTPSFAVIDVASSGDNTLVSAVTSKKIRVLSLFLVSAGTVNVRFESGASGTALTGQMNLIANTGFVLPYNPVGWFETASSSLLNLELSGAISVDGSLTYIEV